YVEVMVNPDKVAAARALKPIHERQALGRSILLFDHADRQQLAALGEVRTPSLADLFVAVMDNQTGPPQRAARALPPPTPYLGLSLNRRQASTRSSRRFGAGIGPYAVNCGRAVRSISRRWSPPASFCSAF